MSCSEAKECGLIDAEEHVDGIFSSVCTAVLLGLEKVVDHGLGFLVGHSVVWLIHFASCFGECISLFIS